MKGQVENTIPQRQFENIKTTYYFENEAQRAEAIKQSVTDCIKLNNIVEKRLNPEKSEVSGVKWEKDEENKWKQVS